MYKAVRKTFNFVANHPIASLSISTLFAIPVSGLWAFGTAILGIISH